MNDVGRGQSRGPGEHVRIFGPNLTGAAQRKGGMHVHAEGCGDVKHYGPGTRYGGGDPDGWLIAAESMKDIVTAVYDPGDFNYDPETELDTYAAEFYVAPCVKGLS